MFLANRKVVRGTAFILILTVYIANVLEDEAMLKDRKSAISLTQKIPSMADLPETPPVGTDASASDAVAATNSPALALDPRNTSLEGTSETCTRTQLRSPVAARFLKPSAVEEPTSD
jgi:hypothetical protein